MSMAAFNWSSGQSFLAMLRREQFYLILAWLRLVFSIRLAFGVWRCLKEVSSMKQQIRAQTSR